jgi:hypothetical protein
MKPSKTSQPNKKIGKSKIPNSLTVITIENARSGIDLGEPIKNVRDFVKSL